MKELKHNKEQKKVVGKKEEKEVGIVLSYECNKALPQNTMDFTINVCSTCIVKKPRKQSKVTKIMGEVVNQHVQSATHWSFNLVPTMRSSNYWDGQHRVMHGLTVNWVNGTKY